MVNASGPKVQETLSSKTQGGSLDEVYVQFSCCMLLFVSVFGFQTVEVYCRALRIWYMV